MIPPLTDIACRSGNSNGNSNGHINGNGNSMTGTTSISMGLSSSSSSYSQHSQHHLNPSQPGQGQGPGPWPGAGQGLGPGPGPGLGPGQMPIQGPYNWVITNDGTISHTVSNKENLSQSSSEANRSQGGPPVDLVNDDSMIDGLSQPTRRPPPLLPPYQPQCGPTCGPTINQSRGQMMMPGVGDQRDERNLAGNKRPLGGVDNEWYLSGSSGASSDSNDENGQGTYAAATAAGAAAGAEGNKRQATAANRGMMVAATGTLGLSVKAPRVSGDDGGSGVAALQGMGMGVGMPISSTHELQCIHKSSSSSQPPLLPSLLPPTVTCVRLIVLDITDDPQRRIKDLTCYIPDNAIGMTADHPSKQQLQQQPQQHQQQQQQQQQQHPTTTSAMNSARVVSSNMVVRVTGDWYHVSIHGGY